MAKIKKSLIKFFFGDTDPRLCAILTLSTFLLLLIIDLVTVDSIMFPVWLILTIVLPLVVNCLSQ